ncbi:hypothetical protein LCGC14_2770090 [marine sediment metagenome]|uniref:Uncharacterized protein n=1 Tax=marine sediment metagenome TaxID=412755 RepID=A0A0F9BMY3_9ZZZZ
MAKKSIQERIDIEFANDLKKMALNRIKNGVDDELRSIREMTAKMTKHPLFSTKLKEDLENFKFKDE